MRLLRDWQGSDEYKRAIKIQDHIELYRDSLPKFDLRYKLPTTISMMKQDARQHQHDSGGCNTKQSQILRGLVNALDDCELDGTVRPVAYMLDTNRHLITTPRDPNAQEESVLIMGRLLDIYMPTNPETEGQGVASDGWTDYLRTYANDEQVAGDVNKLWSKTP